MEKILGIDLGTNSIGWALRNPDIKGNQIEKFGVLTFNKGVGNGKSGEYSYAAERTKKRSTRRLYQARKYRLWATLKALIVLDYCPLSIENLNRWRHYDKEEARKNNNGGRIYPVYDSAFESWIKLDFNSDEKPDYTSPFQLRKELADQKIDLDKKENRYKLGRALYHIAQRRGFKSSRKGSDDIKEKENDNDEIVDLQYSEKKKNKTIIELFEKHPEAKTIGSLFAILENNKIRIRESIAQYAIRENYKDEIKFIFQKQNISFTSELFNQLVETGKNKNDGAIFYKRPLRSQKGLIGKCTLEPNKYRAPISHPHFELFRAWSFLNNIKYKETADDKWQQLTLSLKHEIYNKLFFRKKAYFPFQDITDFLKKQGKSWIFNYKAKTTVTGCPVSARLKDIFGENFLNIQIKKGYKDKNENEYYTTEDIWHILFSFEDQEYVAEYAIEKLKLDDSQLKQFITAWNAMPVGYAMLSINAIDKINVFLLKGLIYTEAVLLANIPGIVGKDLWKASEELLLNEIGKLINENRKQKQILNIVNNLISKHKNLDADVKFGHKDATYTLDNSDLKAIEDACIEAFGIKTWNEKDITKKQHILSILQIIYQAYFSAGLEIKYLKNEKHFIVKADNHYFYKTESGYYRLPKLKDTLSEFLESNFDLSAKQQEKIYHPSEINIYPPAKEDENGILKLGSPKTGSFKNPMAMRTLHELRKLTNYLIETNQINQETRLVVEVARELNDANKRWAIETWQKRREEENNEFSKAIDELLIKEKSIKADSNNDVDIDKIRIWYEQNEKDEETLPPVTEDKKEIKGVNWQSTKKESYKEISAKKELSEKYRLWLEQQCTCMYTGKIIKLTDLFDNNLIDFEHTIPRSISFDNSLANLTVCYADYNRTVKKNQIPYNLINYDKEYGGYSAIEPRLKNWKEKVERIKQQIDFWKTKSKKAADKEWKDKAIRERHLWQMELDYWQNKLDRFTMQEVTNGFKNSQKVDTQLISKYALHYFKTYFERVDVQKGSITAEFRKIYGLQVADQKKDRSKHSHHAKDAAVLTLIPAAAKRDAILQEYYEHKERKQKYTNEPYKGFNREYVWNIDDSVLINNISNNQALTPAKKIVRKRGKIQFIKGTNEPLIATGDAIRGQLHDETFFGAIRLAQKDENGKFIRDENKNLLQEDITKYVLRVPFQYKNKADAPGFKTLEEIEKVIVDKYLFEQIKKQSEDAGSLKEAFEKGIYMFNKKGEKENKIRRIRIFKTVTEPLKIKKQTYLSVHEYKQYYYASNATNLAYGLYGSSSLEKAKISFKIINLFQAAKLKSLETGNSLELENQINIKNEIYYLQAILQSEQKVIFYKKNKQELKELEVNTLFNRLYKIEGFEKDGRIMFKHHLYALSDNDLKQLEEKHGKSIHRGFSVINFEEPWPKLKLSMGNLKMAIEDIDFKIKMDGEIDWLF